MELLSNLSTYKIADIPIGAVAVGAAVGGVGDAVTGVVTGFVPSAPSWAVKGGLAFVTAKWGDKLLGKSGSQVGTLFLAYDAVQELFNLRASVSNIIGGLTGKIVKHSPPQFTGPVKAKTAGSMNYYSRMTGGA
jgi:hypothetical protein